MTTATKKPHVSNNSGNDEWYTPSEYIEAAREVMGSIDLDPASSQEANKIVKARSFFTKENDGLSRRWCFSNVWINPPYSGKLIKQFADVIVEKFKTREFYQAIVLVNNATETSWFQQLASVATAICFLRGRIKFLDSSGHPKKTPLQGQAIFYLGDNEDRFREVFSKFGFVVEKWW